MTTLATADSKWNLSIEKRSDSVLDPRASVATWATTRYAPSVFTFNANWAPGPLVAVAATSTTLSPGVWNRQNLHTGAAGDDKILDDVERVSHLDFSDDEGDGEDEQNKWDGQQKRYGHDDYSPGPTPTQAHAKYQPIYRPSDPFADSNAAYLASYGFTDGLGYERPPPDFSLRSSSPSNYSIYGGDDSYDDNNKNENAANSKFLNYESIRYPLPPSQPTRTSRTGAYSEPPPPPPPWPSSLKASNALLTSLALDAPLRDDPVGSWEALCWEELEGDSDSDSDFGDEDDEDERAYLDGRGGKGEVGEGGGRRKGEREIRNTWDRKDVGHRDAIVEDADGRDGDGWRDFLSSPPSPSHSPSPSPPHAPSPYRHPTYGDDQTETDVRTLSNETSTTETSTITAENSEEWISLTGARAQAARARILPSRAPLPLPLPPSAVATSAAISQVQVPFPTHLQADTSLLLTSSERPTRTPVDPVLAATPPLQMAYQQHEHANANNGAVEDENERAEREGEREGETETAPHYGESGRDRLLTLTERDPPPYDLEYGSEYGSETRRVHEEQHHGGDADEGEERTHIQEVDTVLRTSSSSPFQSQPQPRLSSQYPLPAPRTRSQLTFPTSPTDSLPTLTSRTSPTTASPTDTLTLTTPAGTFFSALFPAPRPPEDSIHYAPGRPGSGSGSGSSKGRGGGSRPASPFSVLSSLGGGSFGHSSPEPKMGSGAESGLRQRPRPLPARPRGARTTAGTWLSASAAGPYANGTRAGLGSPSSSRWGSTSDLGFGVYTGFHNGTRNGNADTELPLAMRVSTEVVVERDDDDDDDDDDREREGERGAKVGEETRVALAPLRREDFFPSPSPSPIYHSNVKTDSSEKPVDRAGSGLRKEGDLKSSSQYHITSKVEAVGTQHRSSSSSSRPLQRLATRCGTLSRRIGIVAGVGVVGRER